MSTAQQLYTELAASLQQYLTQEYERGYRLPVDRASYQRFAEEARTRRYRTQQPQPRAIAKPLPKAPAPRTQPPVKTAKAPVPPATPAQRVPSQPPQATTKTPEAPKETAPPTQNPIQHPPTSPTASPPAAPAAPATRSLTPTTQGQATPQDFTSLRAVLQQQLPSMQHLDAIPDDLQARRIRFQWLHDRMVVAIIAVGVTDDELLFLEKMAKGITGRLAPAYIVTDYHRSVFADWQGLLSGGAMKAIIIPTTAFTADATLSQIHSADGTVCGKPTNIVDVSELVKDAAKKRELWQQLVTVVNGESQ